MGEAQLETSWWTTFIRRKNTYTHFSLVLLLLICHCPHHLLSKVFATKPLSENAKYLKNSMQTAKKRNRHGFHPASYIIPIMPDEIQLNIITRSVPSRLENHLSAVIPNYRGHTANLRST